MTHDKRPLGFWLLAAFFALFVLFMYGPMLIIVILSFQGPEGGLTFPLRGLSLHWFYKLAEGLGVVDIGAALSRSLFLGLTVMAFTVVFSVLAGLAFRKKLAGGNTLFLLWWQASSCRPSLCPWALGWSFVCWTPALKKRWKRLACKRFWRTMAHR